ncbi:MAG: M4 family metallopeptidase, partial [Deltaproteobacteria bacterium]|nr:M4 family metallopeptidase [Deltaproteobacteria bacterium]
MTKVARLFVLLALAGCAGGTEGSLSADDPIGPGLFVPGDVVSEQTAQELAFEHIQQDADMLAGVDGLEPGLVSVDRFGGAHSRFEQTVNGVPVLGGQAIVHLADDGTFAGYTDALVRNPKVDTTPHLTADEATDLAVLSVGGWHTVTGSPNVDLVIVPDPRGAHLTWRVQIAQFEPGAAPAAPLVFVDAHSGEEVLSYNNLRTDFPHDTSPHDPDDYTAYDTYDAQEQTSDDFSDYRLALVGDTIAETAHQNVGLSLAYFWNAHERKSFDDDLDDDGNGAVVNSAVHYDYQYVNAFWYLDALYFGDGDGVYSDALVSLDIVAHELSHGVTEYSADLIYQDESGALNEATSDMFAAAVEAVNGGSFTDIWWVGEDIWLDGDALRYMNDPALAGDPDYYPDRLIGYEDNGYVHWNSGIANLWFHLLSEGGIHP